MQNEGIPQPVADFIAEHIDSVVQLEVLLLLQSHRDQSYSAADVARGLRIDPAWTEAALAKLVAAGVLEVTEPSYRYAPKSTHVDQMISTLAKAYADRPVTIVSAIFAKPPHPVIRKFTDAFRFRKDEEG